MSLITIHEKTELLKNLLSDPDDWVSRRILELSKKAEKPSDKAPPESHPIPSKAFADPSK